MGMFVSCEDELLTGTPDWLGSSIYEELQKRGNYQTTLSLISDPAINQQTVLSLTGSKTLFVANDEAYDRFFKNNSWGVRSFAELSEAQKKLLFNSSMVNSAYLIELMSDLSSEDENTEAGACMRRATAHDVFDSIPVLRAGDMPDNPYWAKFREQYPDGGNEGMLVLRDNTSAWMAHFLPAFMSNNAITDDDLSFLTNGACDNTNESYINGQRLTEQDITCQNGYIQVVENVMEPLPNMAEVIRQDPELSIFSGLLDRFCVPVLDEGNTERYNQYNTGETKPVYVWRYFNSGFDLGANGNALTATDDGVAADNLLPYDPGWNQYRNATASTTAEDMAVIIAPTDDAFNRFFTESGSGKFLMEQYEDVEHIPDHIVVDLLENFMKTSLVATVPSKFETVTNSAGHKMKLSKGEPGGKTGIGSCLMANNGMVYKSNEVYVVPEYQSVAFPASLDDDIRIMRTIIEELNYDAYLNSMDSEFMLILPTDEALSHYVDPVDYQTNSPTVTRFYYNDDPDRKPEDNLIKCYRFRATRNPDGSLSYPDVMNEDLAMANPWDKYATGTDEERENDYVENRLKDVLENSIIVKDRAASAAAGRDVWVTKGGCPLILSGSGEGLRIITPYNKEVAENGGGSPDELVVRQGGYYNMGTNPNGNGETFVVDEDVVNPSSKSVHTLLEELAEKDPRYSEFLNILDFSSLRVLLCDRKGTGSSYKSIGNGYTLSVMQNYNYTVYVPTTEEIQKLYDENLLPTREFVEEKREELENASIAEKEKLQNEVDSLEALIDNFIRYHIQSRAVYLGGPNGSATYETTYLSGGRFSTLRVDNNSSYDGNTLQSGGSLTIQALNRANEPVGDECRVLEGNYFAREYHFRADRSALDVDRDTNNDPVIARIEQATRIYNSATAVVHLIDKPLPYYEIMGLEATQN